MHKTSKKSFLITDILTKSDIIADSKKIDVPFTENCNILLTQRPHVSLGISTKNVNLSGKYKLFDYMCNFNLIQFFILLIFDKINSFLRSILRD